MTALSAGLVSTVIPVRNRPALLREAVRSVLAQTYRPIEIVIVDDGSTDETGAVALRLQDQHAEVRVVQLSPSGVGAARNVGLALIQGEFVQFLDSDDLLLPDKFAVQVAALQASPASGIAYCKVREYPHPGTWNGQPARSTAQAFSTLFPALARDRIWCAPSPLYRRTVIDAIGGFEPASIHEDWEFEARAGALGVRLAHCDVYLADKRNVHVKEGRNKGGARDAQLAEYAAMQLLIMKHAVAGGVDSDMLKMVASRLCAVAERCAAGGAVAEARRSVQAARELTPDVATQVRLAILVGAARVAGWQRAARVVGQADALGERIARLLVWPGRIVRYLQRRRREWPLMWRAHRILTRYTAHHRRAQQVYRSATAAPPPLIQVEDVGVRVINDSAAPGVALPAGFRERVAVVAASAAEAFRDPSRCGYFPPLKRNADGSAIDAEEAVRRGDVITIKLADPLELDGVAALAEALVGQIERCVYGSYVLVDKVYVYRSPISRRAPLKSWLWHFDNHPREMLKLMVYLTDVGEGTAPFEYIRDRATGRPRPGAPLAPKLGDSRVPEHVVDGWLANGHERVAVTGPAGTVLLFDDNVVHRATLATTAPRDVIVFQLRPAAFKPAACIDPRWTGTFVHHDFHLDPWLLTPRPL